MIAARSSSAPESLPLLAKIREHILAAGKNSLPRSKAGQACDHAGELDELDLPSSTTRN